MHAKWEPGQFTVCAAMLLLVVWLTRPMQVATRCLTGTKDTGMAACGRSAPDTDAQPRTLQAALTVSSVSVRSAVLLGGPESCTAHRGHDAHLISIRAPQMKLEMHSHSRLSTVSDLLILCASNHAAVLTMLGSLKLATMLQASELDF